MTSLSRRLPLLLALPLLLVACADGLTGDADPADARTPPALLGAWEWSEVSVLFIPPEVLASENGPGLFGPIEPEGPLTRIACPSSGVLTIGAQSDTQNGSAFSGASTQVSDTCISEGGQAGPAPFPPFLDLVDGTTRGRRFDFTFVAEGPPGAPPIPCAYKGRVRVQGGIAVEMRGTGTCDVPDALGPDSKVFGFRATRATS